MYNLIPKTKRNYTHGITLIALIIIIVILIILAGITINTLLSNNGLIKKIDLSIEETQKSQVLEELKLKVLQVQTDKDGFATLKDLVNFFNLDNENKYIISSTQITNITEETPDVTNSNEIYVIYKNYQFKIDNNLIITFVGNYEQNLSQDKENNFVELFSGVADNTTQPYSLNDSITNYDFIIVYADNSTVSGIESIMIEPDIIVANDLDQFLINHFVNSSFLRRIRFGFNTDSSFSISEIKNNSYINRIVGIKKGKTTKTELYTTTANTIGTYNLKDDIDNFDYIMVYTDNGKIQSCSTSLIDTAITTSNIFVSVQSVGSTNRMIRYKFDNKKTFDITYVNDSANISRIVGINFNNAKKNILYNGIANNFEYQLNDDIQNYDIILTYANHSSVEGIGNNVIESNYIINNKENVRFMNTLSTPSITRVIRYSFKDSKTFQVNITGNTYMQIIEGLKFN